MLLQVPFRSTYGKILANEPKLLKLLSVKGWNF
jgi:hypothetical protein